MNEAKLLTLLGFAQKAGKLASGELAVDHAIKSGKAQLLIVAADASANTKKAYNDATSFYSINYHEALTKEQLGNATGKSPRAAVAVIDTGFGKAIRDALMA